MSETNPTPEEVQNYILAGLECSYIKVTGDGRHFKAVVVSPIFEGLRTLVRHQRVYAVLGDRMKDEIHALSIRTHTPEEYQALIS